MSKYEWTNGNVVVLVGLLYIYVIKMLEYPAERLTNGRRRRENGRRKRERDDGICVGLGCVHCIHT